MNNDELVIELAGKIEEIIKKNNIEATAMDSKNNVKKNVVNEILDTLDKVAKNED